MKRIILLLITAAVITGCDTGTVRTQKGVVHDYQMNCIDGVTYLLFPGGAVVQLDRSGRPVPCDLTPPRDPSGKINKEDTKTEINPHRRHEVGIASSGPGVTETMTTSIA